MIESLQSSLRSLPGVALFALTLARELAIQESEPYINFN